MNTMIRIFAFLFSILVASTASAADYPTPTEGDFTIRDFKFQSGETLPELRIHYRTLGKPEKDAEGKATNAVLIMHGTTGSGAQFIRPEFAGELFGKDQPLDATKFFIVLPDGIGHGKSSKPSDGMHAKFPRYGYLDMVEADYRLLTEGLGLSHARLVMGTSMGGMHTWLWGERYPDFMDALVPLASLPTQISGRNRVKVPATRALLDGRCRKPILLIALYRQEDPVDDVSRSLVIDDASRAEFRDGQEAGSLDELVFAATPATSWNERGQRQSGEAVSRQEAFARQVSIAVEVGLP